MFRKIMNYVPVDVHANVGGLLARKDKELVHIAYGSMLESDENIYALVARYEESEDERGYSVYSYDREKKKLFRELDRVTYADALIEMGERIKE